jgi:alkanesulfonate monooxygenase SsuD/methylene tetrahydromethanopterin reductase-like flavin-dependent oxidoreductase (luciferase family)
VQVTRFGLQIPNFMFPGVGSGDLFERIAQIAVAAEESEFDSVWVWTTSKKPCRSAGPCSPKKPPTFAGLDGMVFNMHDAQNLDPVRLAGRTLSAAFG